MSDNISSEASWPAWKIALAVGVPAVIAGAGLYYYTSKKPSKATPTVESKVVSRSEPEGSSSPQKQTEVSKEVETPKKTKLQEAQDLKNEGNVLFKQGLYQEAIDKYAEAIQVCPTSSKTKTDKSAYHQNMAAAMEKMENWEGVVKECSAAIELNQRYVKALMRRSKAYEKLNQKENCLEDITTVCILEGFQNQGSMMYADDILKQLGKEKASDTFKNRKPLIPSRLFMQQYLDSFSEGMLSTPLTDEQKLQSSESGFIRARIALANGDYDNIIEECSVEISATADKPQEGFEGQQKGADYKPEAYLLRGTMRMLCGDRIHALEDLNAVIEMENAHKKLRANALIKRGSMNMQHQEAETAQGDFVQALQIDADNCDVYHHRGQLYILLDKATEALADFEKCIELKPDFALAHAQKCYTMYRQACNNKDYLASQQAIGDFERIIEKYPNCTETYGLFAQAHADNGNFDKADQLFLKATQVEPENATIYVHRGLLALQWKQDLDQAVSLISKALEIDEKCDFAHETMGTIEVQRGNLEKAISHFDVSISYAKTELEMAHLYALQAAARAQGNIAKKYGLKPPGVM